jgi:hypothetical protein
MSVSIEYLDSRRPLAGHTSFLPLRYLLGEALVFDCEELSSMVAYPAISATCAESATDTSGLVEDANAVASLLQRRGTAQTSHSCTDDSDMLFTHFNLPCTVRSAENTAKNFGTSHVQKIPL